MVWVSDTDFLFEAMQFPFAGGEVSTCDGLGTYAVTITVQCGDSPFNGAGSRVGYLIQPLNVP